VSSKPVLNLVGVLSPFCLLKIKKMLMENASGENIQVLLQDFDVIDDLKKILDFSVDEIVEIQKKKNHYKITIRKG
jgi:TusA-related sulfurtransferase